MLGPACCLLVAAFSSAIVEAAAGADGEVAAGRAPVDVLGPERDSLTFTVVPGAGLRLRSGSTSLSLTYTPRIFYRLPNTLNLDRPLLLHQVALAHTGKPSARVSWNNGAELSVGELDYTAASVVFDPAVSTVRTSLADVLRAEAHSGLTFEVTKRLQLNWGLSVDYTTSLDDSPGLVPEPLPDGSEAPLVAGASVPESASGTADFTLSYALSRYDRIATTTEVTYQYFSDGGRFLLISPELSWDSQLSRRTSFGLSGGVAYVLTLEGVDGDDATDSAIGGTGSAQFGSELYKSGRVLLNFRTNASLEWFFDPILGTSQPRAGAEVALDLQLGRQWSINPSTSFYAVLRSASATPIVADLDGDGMVDLATTQITPDATVLRAELPVRYAVSDALSLTWGGRAALRGRALSQDGFRLDEQVELWAFFGLAIRFSTGERDAGWLSL